MHRRDRLRLSLAEPLRLADHKTQRFRGWRHFQCVLVRVHAFGELDTIRIEACGVKLAGQLLGRAITGLVTVIGDQHALGAVALERRQVIGGKSLDAVARRDVAEPCAPEGERIDQRLAEDDFRGAGERRLVPHAPMRPRQIQVIRRAQPQAFGDLAAVNFRDLAG